MPSCNATLPYDARTYYAALDMVEYYLEEQYRDRDRELKYYSSCRDRGMTVDQINETEWQKQSDKRDLERCEKIKSYSATVNEFLTIYAGYDANLYSHYPTEWPEWNQPCSIKIGEECYHWTGDFSDVMSRAMKGEWPDEVIMVRAKPRHEILTKSVTEDWYYVETRRERFGGYITKADLHQQVTKAIEDRRVFEAQQKQWLETVYPVWAASLKKETKPKTDRFGFGASDYAKILSQLKLGRKRFAACGDGGEFILTVNDYKVTFTSIKQLEGWARTLKQGLDKAGKDKV